MAPNNWYRAKGKREIDYYIINANSARVNHLVILFHMGVIFLITNLIYKFYNSNI